MWRRLLYRMVISGGYIGLNELLELQPHTISSAEPEMLNVY